MKSIDELCVEEFFFRGYSIEQIRAMESPSDELYAIDLHLWLELDRSIKEGFFVDDSLTDES